MERNLSSLAYALNCIFMDDHKIKCYDITEDPHYAMVAEDTSEPY